jgi:hypothetical protein
MSGSFSRRKYARFAALTTTAIKPDSERTTPFNLILSIIRQRLPPEVQTAASGAVDTELTNGSRPPRTALTAPGLVGFTGGVADGVADGAAAVPVAGFEVVAVGFCAFALLSGVAGTVGLTAARSGFKNGLRSGATCWTSPGACAHPVTASNKIALAALQTIASFYAFGFTNGAFAGGGGG